ncbi:MAG: hypothetical protein AAFV31_03400 [Pseudomonadota bacterium]
MTVVRMRPLAVRCQAACSVDRWPDRGFRQHSHLLSLLAAKDPDMQSVAAPITKSLVTLKPTRRMSDNRPSKPA